MDNNSIVIGIDIGGSTTKICGFGGGGKILIEPLFIKASDQIASIYGAFGKFCSDNAIPLDKIGHINVTGVGSTFVTKPLYGIETERVAEFTSSGLGGMYLSGLGRVIVVSMGTGTAIIKADRTEKCEYLGGTGVGGGTLLGLARKLLGMESIEGIVELASKGNLANINLTVGDITKGDIKGLSHDMTASNFGKVNDRTSGADIALGLIDMIFETIGMMSIFAARKFAVDDIVLTGSLTRIPQCGEIFGVLERLFGIRFIIPERAPFGTVIGSALHYFK